MAAFSLWKMVLLLLGSLALLENRVAGVKFSVGPLREECFYATDVPAGALISVHYQVVAGGARDIDLSIWGPYRQFLHSGEKQKEGHVSFASKNAGEYKFCFSNRRWAFVTKTISVRLVVDQNLIDSTPRDSLELSIERLAQSIKGLKEGQHFLKDQDEVQQQLAEQTSSQVLCLGIWEALLLIAVSIWQVTQIRRYFEGGSSKIPTLQGWMKRMWNRC